MFPRFLYLNIGNHNFLKTKPMKKLYTFLFLVCAPLFMNAQCGVQIQAVGATCNGACDGSASAFPFGGVGPYTYLWAPGGQTTQSITGLCAGSYTVTVVDAAACTATGTAVITQPTQIIISLSPTNASCSSCCDGFITSNVTGGTPGYVYAWSTMPVQTTPTAQALCPGTYTLCVTDVNGCTSCSVATVNFPTGIADPQSDGALTVFPSPAVQLITVHKTFANAVPAVITISNVLGETVYTKSVSTTELNETINVAGFTDGVYFISVQTINGTSIRRFVKE
jgi:hypothetical protein